MVEHAVQHDADAQRAGLFGQLGQRRLTAEARVDLEKIAHVVFMVGIRLGHRAQVDHRRPERADIIELLGHAVQRAAEKAVVAQEAPFFDSVFGDAVLPVVAVDGVRAARDLPRLTEAVHKHMVNDAGVVRARGRVRIDEKLPLAAEALRERTAERLLAGVEQAVLGFQLKVEKIKPFLQCAGRRAEQRGLPFPLDGRFRALHENAVVAAEIEARAGKRRRTPQPQPQRKGRIRADITQRRLASVRKEADKARGVLFDVKKAVQVRPSRPSRRFRRQILSAYSVMLRSAAKIPALATFVSAIRFQRARSS